MTIHYDMRVIAVHLEAISSSNLEVIHPIAKTTRESVKKVNFKSIESPWFSIKWRLTLKKNLYKKSWNVIFQYLVTILKTSIIIYIGGGKYNLPNN